jgi:hypothetical protein
MEGPALGQGNPARYIVKSLTLRVLRLFREMGKDRLDLHALFEAAGNEPAEREGVLDAIDELIRAGILDACGSDFYMLTERGKETIAQS